MPYTQGFKARMIQRMAGPEGITANALSNEVGVSQELDLPFPVARLVGVAPETVGLSTGIPKLLLLDGQGRIRYRRSGHNKGSGDRFRQEIGWVLEGIRGGD
ncbi:MAG: hypothetical protein ACI8QC_004228 [Planctomycetota bacterium]